MCVGVVGVGGLRDAPWAQGTEDGSVSQPRNVR